ncbi:hypothetical protein [Streptococcus oralis]|uniref:hypothetical protein n=1 Tax=Streptococcus oralis TaxID=1303 RepID=UPI002001A9F8|nr:hypothetical protein [Streptococcus oralis]
MKKRALILLVLSIVVFGGGAWLAQETNLFLSPRAKQLAYLKEHEEEIKDFVKSQNPKIESVQIDWRQTQWDKVGNGTPQGGGDIIDVYGTFNNIDNSGWHVMIIVDDGKVDLASMTLVNGLGIGGKLLD